MNISTSEWKGYPLTKEATFRIERYASMAKVSAATVKGLLIEGMEGDYVFETLKKQNNFYENAILEKWLPYMKDSKFLLDIGANIGNHTLFWSQNINYAAIYSFEPFPANYERLVNNVANNSLKNVFPSNCGVGACKGYTSILRFSEENYGATALDTQISDSGDIKIIDIDSFVSEYGLNQIDFVKIDTEGFEESVLSGMRQTIELHYPDLWIEVSEESFHYVINTLLAMGYVIVDVEGFNILFLNAKRHGDIHSVDVMHIFAQHFNNLSRTNKYYQLYTRSKEWVKSRDTVIENLNQCNIGFEKELLASEQKIQEQEECILLLKKEKTEIEEHLKETQKRQQEFTQELASLVGVQNSKIPILQHVKHVLQNQQNELQSLSQENETYRQRWHELSSKWYGRLALKACYRLKKMDIFQEKIFPSNQK